MQHATAIKWGLLLGGAVAALWAIGRVGQAVSGTANAVWNAATDAAWAVSPTNNENVIYQTANTLTGGTPDTSIGSRIYDWVHPSPFTPPPPRIDHSDPSRPLVNSDGYDFSLF